MDSTTTYNISYDFGTAIFYAFPPILIIISRFVSRLISRKTVKNMSVWAYGIIFTIVMLIVSQYDLEYLTLRVFVFSLLLYALCFYIDYLFYKTSKSKPKFESKT